MSTARGQVGLALEIVIDGGLGNASYLLDLGDGRALAVDPPRDLRALRVAADRRGLRIAYAADTHLHADFLTGARQLAESDGAMVLAAAAGGRLFEHRGLADGDDVDLGGLTLRARSTPGHTDEHLAYLVLDGRHPIGVFTGGSLLVGSAARTDLLGPERTDELAHAQYASLRRLAMLPDHVAVWPTHGAGSFCSAPSGASRTSTIGAEKAANPLLLAPDAEAFAEQLRGSLGTYPAYFERLAELNRHGPGLITAPPLLAPLSSEDVRRLLADGGYIVDVRPVADYAAAHISSAISIPLRAQFATWLGWLLPPGASIVVVRNDDQDPGDILWSALNVGYETIAGELAGGTEAWAASGGEVRSMRTLRPGAMETSLVIDVRQDSEHASGHLPGALLVELGALADRAAELPRRPLGVMCGHGERAATAASLLERAGHRDVSILLGGPAEWAAATGRGLHPTQ